MQSLEAACEEAENILEKLSNNSFKPFNQTDNCVDSNLGLLATNSNKSFCIFTKLRELYLEECGKEFEAHMNSKCNSFLLEKLVARESLNTLILNLYPDKNEYSFALRMGSIVDDLNVGNSFDKLPNTLNDENYLKTWHPDDELLKYIDNEELPCILVDILEQDHQELFYSGCVIVEVRDYQQNNSQVLCEKRHVLLRPTVQSLWADMDLLIDKTEQEWTEEEKLELESELTIATNPVLCLDPKPAVSVINSIVHHQRYIFNTEPLKRCAHRFSLVNRKRKLDTLSQISGSDLHGLDFIVKKKRSVKSVTNSLSKLKVPKMVLPAPTLEPKIPLSLPIKVDTSQFRSYTGPKDTINCLPHLIEEYILDTDRQCERDQNKIYHLHIKLSILQRPLNYEFLGELYLDVDYKQGKNNGASSRFTLGSRSYVDKFIRQFTDMLTKKGRKKMNIMKRVPGQEPRFITIPQDKNVDSSQQTPVHNAQSAVQTAQIQNTQLQIASDSNTLGNSSTAPNVLFVPNQSTIQNTSTVPILQAQLQSSSQTKIEARHSTNPEITALVASLEEAAVAAAAAASTASTSSKPQASGNNAAILSLLNTSPVNSVNSATSAAVANAITNNNQSNIGPVLGLSQQQTLQTINQKLLGRKMTITNVPRVLNHGNVITVNNNSVPGSTVVSVPQQVQISALASQLASPPVNVIIATASQQQQGQGFSLTTVSGTGFPNHVSYTTVPINSATNKNLRTFPKTCTSDNNTGMSVSGLSALLVNTPSADNPMPGSNNASALLERLTASSSGTSPVPVDNSNQFNVQPSKTVQQLPVQLSKNNPVISPLSSPPTQTTLNVHTLNLTPFPATLNNISGIQNVQVQLPRLSTPLHQSSTNTIQTPTGLIFSVAVTTATTACSTTTHVNHLGTSTLNSSTSTVVLTNTPSASVSPVLPLPIAQLVASGVKSLTQQGICVTSPNAVSLAQTGKSVQIVGTVPCNTQMANMKARGLIQAQRMANAALKMATSNTNQSNIKNSL